jgi:1-acyl-sn-glycerol-3-phosphate acyltransferase
MYELMTLTGRPYVDVYAASLKTAIVAPAPSRSTPAAVENT